MAFIFAVPFSVLVQAQPANPSAPAVLATETPPVAEWKPNLKWSGDLRYRFARGKESIDEERKYQQLRARLGVRADVNESAQAIVRLATATSAISSNQTMGDSKDPGMARRSFGLDLGYIDWKVYGPITAWVGRTANPFWAPAKTQFLWDGDLAFEGLSFKWEPKWADHGPFVNIGTTMISENYQAASGGAPGQDSVDTGMVGLQAGYMVKGEDWSAIWHFANYYFLNVKDVNITRFEKDASIDVYSYPNDRYRGNTVYVNDPLLPAANRKYFFSNQYILLETGLELKYKLGPVDLSLFGDLVKNDAAPRLNNAYEAGLAAKWKMLTLAVAQIKKESDSMLGAFTDSDSNGGGTDNEGTRISLGVEISKNAAFQINQFQARRGVDTVKRDYSATQADLLVSF